MAQLSPFEYYETRVLASQAMAQQAKTPEVRAVHLELAERYRSLSADAARDMGTQRLGSGDTAQPAV